VESLPCFAEALSAVEGEVEGDLLSGFPDIFDYYFDPTAWSSFRHYLNSEAGPVEIEWQWTARKRQQAGIFLTVRARLPADNPRPSRAWTGHPSRVRNVIGWANPRVD